MTGGGSTFFARYSRGIILLVALAFPLVAYGSIVAMQSNHNDIKEWLPESFQETQEYNKFQRQFSNDTFVLASWDGCTLDDSRLPRFAAALEPSAQRQREKTEYFSKVITGRSVLNQLTSPPTNLSWKQAIPRLTGSLIGPDGSQTCAVLTASAFGKEHFRAMLDEVERVAVECDIPPNSLRLAGPPVDNVAIDRVSESLRQELMVLSGVLGLSLAWWYLRDVRLTAMVFVAGLYTATLCLAILAFTGGVMNSVLFTMPAVVYTAGLSAAIHVVNYYRYARADEGLEGAADRGLKAAWLPCLLSAGTTSLGLVSLCTSAIVPIKTFGLYTSIGVMSAVGLIFLFLPAALQLWPPRQADTLGTDVDYSPRNVRHRKRMRRLGVLVIARPLWVWAVFMVVLVVCGAGLHRVKTTVNLMSLFSPHAQIIESYRWLEDKVGKMAPMEVVLRLDERTCKLTLVERLELTGRIQMAVEHISPQVGRTMSAVTFVPDLTPKKRGGLGGVFLRGSTWALTLNKRLKEHQAELISGDYVAEDKEAHEQLWRISVRVAALADVDYGEFIHELQQHVDPIIQVERDKGVEGINGVTYTGLVPVVYKAERELLNGLVDSFFSAFLMMALMMTIVFRDIRAGLYTMLPNVWPIAVVFGLMGWARIALDIGTMMTASVAMGVCVDDTVHFANWFRRATRLGLDRPQAVVLAYENSAGAIYQSTVIVALGVGDFCLERVHADPAVWLPDEHLAVFWTGRRPGALAGDAFRADRQVFHPQLPSAAERGRLIGPAGTCTSPGPAHRRGPRITSAGQTARRYKFATRSRTGRSFRGSIRSAGSRLPGCRSRASARWVARRRKDAPRPGARGPLPSGRR